MQKEGLRSPTEGTTTQPTNVGGNRSKGPVRVYAMGQQEVTNPSAGIEGTLSLFGVPQVF